MRLRTIRHTRESPQGPRYGRNILGNTNLAEAAQIRGEVCQLRNSEDVRVRMVVWSREPGGGSGPSRCRTQRSAGSVLIPRPECPS